jgi:hypothetical protein
MSEIEELNVNLNRKNAELHSSLEVQASNYKAQVLLIYINISDTLLIKCRDFFSLISALILIVYRCKQ